MAEPESALPPFEIFIRPGEARVVVELHGELCMQTAPEVTARLAGLFNGEHTEVIVDLRGVSFMDSTGVRLLIETDERAAASDVEFAIVLEDNQPNRVLELVGLPDRPRRTQL